MVEGARNLTKIFRRKWGDGSDAPSTTLRSLRELRAVPPRFHGAEDPRPPRSRDASSFFVSRAMRHAIARKTTPPTRPSSACPGSGKTDASHSDARTVARSSDAPGWMVKGRSSQSRRVASCRPGFERSEIRGRSCGFHCRSRTAAPGFRFAHPAAARLSAKQGSRTPTDAVRNRLASQARGARTLQGALACRRSTARSCPRDSRIPRDSASDQASRSAAPIGGGTVSRRPRSASRIARRTPCTTSELFRLRSLSWIVPKSLHSETRPCTAITHALA